MNYIYCLIYSMNETENEFITMTVSLRRKLALEERRTGISVRAILQDRTDLPDGLTKRDAQRLMSGIIKTSPKAHIDYLSNLWLEIADDAGRITSDGVPVVWTQKHDEHFIPLIDAMIAQLHAEMKRTGMTPRAFAMSCAKLPEGLNQAIITDWLHARRKTVSQAYWNFVINALGKLPNKSDTPALPVNRNHSTNEVAGRPDYRRISDNELLALVTHRDRTGIKATALLKSAPDKPSGLRAETVKAWTNGQTRSADPAMLKYVLDLYASLPDKQ